jgi:hypothetical protein
MIAAKHILFCVVFSGSALESMPLQAAFHLALRHESDSEHMHHCCAVLCITIHGCLTAPRLCSFVPLDSKAFQVRDRHAGIQE